MCYNLQYKRYSLVKMTCLIQKSCLCLIDTFGIILSTPSLALGTTFCSALPGEIEIIMSHQPEILSMKNLIQKFHPH